MDGPSSVCLTYLCSPWRSTAWFCAGWSQVCSQNLQSVPPGLDDTGKQTLKQAKHGNNYTRVILLLLTFLHKLRWLVTAAPLSDICLGCRCVTSGQRSVVMLVCTRCKMLSHPACEMRWQLGACCFTIWCFWHNRGVISGGVLLLLDVLMHLQSLGIQFEGSLLEKCARFTT